MKNLLAALLCLSTTFAHANTNDLETTGDLLQIGLPIVTLASSYWLDDDDTPDNLRYTQFVKSFTYGFLATHFLKLTVNKRRPHGGDNRSFPSGHAFAAFSSASFIHSRFGYKYSIPAFILSGVVGYSRIDSKSHYADDVLAGAALAFLVNQYFTDSDRALSVNISGDSVNLNIATSLDAPTSQSDKSYIDLSFLFGPTYAQHLNFTTDNNTVVRLSDIPQKQAFNFTANAQLDWQVSSNHTLTTTFRPYEHVISGSHTKDIIFENNTFTGGSTLNINWIQYDVDLDYLYLLPAMLRFADIHIGAGLFSNYAQLKIQSPQNINNYKSDQLGFIANLVGRFKVHFSDSFTSQVQLNWYNDPVSKYFKARLLLDYEMNQRWSLIAQLQHHDRTMALSKFNESNVQRTIISQSSFNDINVGIKLDFL